MRTKLIVVLAVLVQTAWAQETIKIRKPLSQEEQTSMATLAGLYSGSCSYTQLLAGKKIRISNNKDGRYTIIRFNTTFSDRGVTRVVGNSGDSLNAPLLEMLDKYYIAGSNKRTRLWIDPIVAVDNITKDTLLLNPIVIEVKGK